MTPPTPHDHEKGTPPVGMSTPTQPHCGTCRWFDPAQSQIKGRGVCLWPKERTPKTLHYEYPSFTYAEDEGCPTWETKP